MGEAKAPAVETPSRSIQTKFEVYTGDEPYLFVSYSHHDADKVYPILDALYDKKYRIWYDESCENGSDFRDELRHMIKGCSAVLLFVSSSSMQSPFCGMEIIVARENAKRIYPIYLEDSCVPPAFEILLSNTHHGTTENIAKLIKTLVRDLPAEAMDRLTTTGDGRLTRCEDNGHRIAVDEGISVICSGAFKNRRALHHIDLPETLEEIESEAFRGCSSLEEIHIPKLTGRIGESAFRDCVSMKKLVITNDHTKVGERAFENCASLEEICLPDGMTEIYGGVFNSCKMLRSISLPEGLTVIGESAFSDCVSLEKISIPKSVTKIDDLVFNGCLSLSLIDIPVGLRKIGKNAFKGCKKLSRIDLPVSLSSISGAPFRGCENLRSIRVDPKNKHFKSEPNKSDGHDHVLFNKNKSLLISYPANSREVQYDIPDSVTVISEWAFCDSKKLNRVTIPDSVQEIGEGAFANCTLLDEVEIPDSVIRLDDCAFRGCKNLESVIIPSSVTDMGWGIFDGCEDSVTVYCDENSVAQRYCLSNNIRQARICELTSAD